MDRPSRKTKAVNYCESKDFDDDEDFACVRAPPSKKVREDGTQEQKKSLGKPLTQETNSQSCQKSRKPLDEKLCERDLEAAITLSMLNNADEIKDQSPASKGDAKFPVDENTDPASLLLSNCSVDGAVMGLDKITSEKGSPAPSRQRTAASKATEELRKKDDDEDYEPKLTPDSEYDDDFSEPSESEDEEFKVKKVSKTKKKEKATKSEKTKRTPASKKEKQPSKPSKSKSQGAVSSTPVRSPPTTTPTTKRPASSSTVCISKPAASLSTAVGKMPKWNPPGQIGKSPSSSQTPAVKSPSQGLRLGLSRLVRVKPLHPSVASH
ncbi:RAD51-associated protein 1 [Archocentrus centrarchus]|uniref:RAD51-associated protein 1 n=1 Tax=Archocentrus centrarchus TaxID=63155 RepID=UPI0011E9E2A4|nr:RAD51-associated protein 1 [Archocentrus centrarchus]